MAPLSLPGSYSPGIGSGSSPALIADVTKTWSPDTTGELQLRPGMSVFQTTFSVSLHVSGKARSSGTSPAFGPRNLAHSPCPSASGAPVSNSSAHPTMAITRRSIGILPVVDRTSVLPGRGCSPALQIVRRILGDTLPPVHQPALGRVRNRRGMVALPGPLVPRWDGPPRP